MGVYFGINAEFTSAKNWNLKVEKLEKLITQWQKRKLTMIGRIQIVKSLLIPQITYLTTVICMPKNILKRVEHLIYKFIWDNKSEKVKRTTLIKNFKEGGLKMIDLQAHIKTLQSKWILKLLDKDEGQWKILPKYYYNKFGKNLIILKFNLDNIKSLPNVDTIPLFYREVLNAWYTIKDTNQIPNEPVKIGNQIIWGKKYIKFKNKTLLFNNWIDSDILTIKDLLNTDGEICENKILPKLENKVNWIAQISILKKSIPHKWKKS